MKTVEQFLAEQGRKKVRIEHVTPESDLEHHGVKGMKWGIRKRRPSGEGSGKVSTPKPKAHELSDEELKKAVSRMQMERQYNTLSGVTTSKGRKAVKVGAAFVSGIALNVARNQLQNHASKQVEAALAKKAAQKAAKKATG